MELDKLDEAIEGVRNKFGRQLQRLHTRRGQLNNEQVEIDSEMEALNEKKSDVETQIAIHKQEQQSFDQSITDVAELVDSAQLLEQALNARDEQFKAIDLEVAADTATLAALESVCSCAQCPVVGNVMLTCILLGFTGSIAG